ncbi:hypothetical protein FB561_5770 [Kribbella amoyensis]|uniref:Transmembrane protein n=1 Tax=Kribbella amoyensis TaxID=996641 RepID=A0A561C0J6_9ACTN|nr:hypothetical protein [Kribbella amoyensis]TWD84577.1 hypothetical protein FB561_5770 [Kribbella amoyensis]
MRDKPRYAEQWVVIQARRLAFGRNPLRRRVDRVESALLIVTLLLSLFSIPVAGGVGSVVRDRSEAAAARQRALLHPVQARTLEPTVSAIGLAPGQVTSRVRVGWLDATGVSHETWTDVVVGTDRGTELTLWLDRSDRVVASPRSSADSGMIGDVAGLVTVMLLWLLLYGAFLAARFPLDRHRAESWADEWKQVAPRWNGNQR